MNALSRRGFVQSLVGLSVSTIGLVLLDGCNLISAAQRAKVPRIGYLGDPPDQPWVQPLWDGLRELGWVEGQTVTIERRATPASGTQQTEVSALVAELLALRVDVLVTEGTPATSAAKRATDTIPIVFISVTNPVGVGVVASLARPGGNVTGVSGGASTSLTGKQLELLKDVVPGLKRVAVILDSVSTASAISWIEIQTAAGVLGVQVQGLDVYSADDLDDAFATAARWPADGVIVRGAPGGIGQRARIVDLAARGHLPTIGAGRETVDLGGLMSYGQSLSSMHRQAATYVDKILRGATPADLPVEQLTTIEFAVNLKTAQALGLTIPPSVAAQVTDWVQ